MGMNPPKRGCIIASKEDTVDPSEYWKDEAMVSDDYANIYLDPKDCLVESPGLSVQVLKPDIVDWLNENVGDRRAHGLEWYQDMESYDWHVRGVTLHHGKSAVQICVRHSSSALLLKLTWRGI